MGIGITKSAKSVSSALDNVMALVGMKTGARKPECENFVFAHFSAKIEFSHSEAEDFVPIEGHVSQLW